jgi:hypothetical protein
MPSKSIHIPQTTPAERRQHREARSADQRAQALTLRHAGATYTAIGHALGVSMSRAAQIVHKGERLAEHPRWFDGLPARAISFLIRNNLAALREVEAAQAVARLSRRELMSNPNFGRGACDALCGWLAAHGLALAPPCASPLENNGDYYTHQIDVRS